MGILTKIRQRPEHQKRIFSFIGALVLTAIIFIVWLAFTTSSSRTAEPENQDNLSSISPMQVIKDEFSKAFSNFNQNTDEMTASTSSSTIPIEVIEATSSEQ